MEALRNGKPGAHECWEELAEHSLTHDDLGSPIFLAAQSGTLTIGTEPGGWSVIEIEGEPLPHYPQRGERGWY